jgi:hypothetical protein
MDRAFDKAGADDPEVTVDAVIKAPFQNRFSARAVVGKRTSVMLMLSPLPIRARDRLVKGALGLSAALKPLGQSTFTSNRRAGAG